MMEIWMVIASWIILASAAYGIGKANGYQLGRLDGRRDPRD